MIDEALSTVRPPWNSQQAQLSSCSVTGKHKARIPPANLTTDGCARDFQFQTKQYIPTSTGIIYFELYAKEI